MIELRFRLLLGWALLWRWAIILAPLALAWPAVAGLGVESLISKAVWTSIVITVCGAGSFVLSKCFRNELWNLGKMHLFVTEGMSRRWLVRSDPETSRRDRRRHYKDSARRTRAVMAGKRLDGEACSGELSLADRETIEDGFRPPAGPASPQPLGFESSADTFQRPVWETLEPTPKAQPTGENLPEAGLRPIGASHASAAA